MRLWRLLSTLPLWMRSRFRRSQLDQELDEEVRDHIERRIAADVGRGLSREQARLAALRAFGGVEQAKDACRDVRRLTAIEHTVQDLRFAVRLFARAPIVTATIIGVFAVGIGFSTALFLFVDSFLNGPVPGIPRHESLVRIRGIDRTRPGRALGREFSYPEYQDYAAQRTLFSGVAAWTSSDIVFDVNAGEANPQSGAATYVTGNYFQLLGIRPALGRGLPVHADDANTAAPPVAVISDVLWDKHFARAPDVIGRDIEVNGVAVTIVGVAPRRFAGARTGGSQMRIWLPLNTRPLVQHTTSVLNSYDDGHLGLAARLQPGVRVEQTKPTVEAVAERVAQRTTGSATARIASTDVVPLIGSNYFPPSGADPESSAGPVIALVFPLLVLLITCTNVSALLAGVGVTRRREIAVQLALGASRRRIVRQLLTEAVMLAMTAGALAMFVIWLMLRLFDASIPDLAIEIDWRAVALTFTLALLAGGLFGFSPALNATRMALQEGLKDGAGATTARRLRLQSALVVAQIAVTQPALLGMGALLLQMRDDLRDVRAQPFADRLLELRFNLNPRYGPLDDARERTLVRLQKRLGALPGVAGIVAQESGESFDIEIHPADTIAGMTPASPQRMEAIAAPAGYFPLMDLTFVRGRDFDAAERSEDGAVVIGRGLTHRLWGDADPIGRRFISVGPNLHGVRMFTIVGVVDDASSRARDDASGAARIFMSRVHTTSHLMIRTRGPAEELLPTIRAAAAAEAPALPVIAARTLAAVEAAERRSAFTAISAAGGTAALALLLSAIGLYAVVAFAVGQRSREIGIRTAFGAESHQMVTLFVRRGLHLGLFGLGIGLGFGIVGVRIISAVEGYEPPSGTIGLSAIVAAFVLAVALLASWVPARRAARIDPLEALRVD